jgi:16S rRNA (cytosine967-C5)-methyltransferase
VFLRVERGAFANAALDAALSASTLDERDRALVTALVDGTLRWRGRLDYTLEHYLAQPLDSLTPAIRTILRLGAHQILFMRSIPARAACDEAVRMARTRGHRGTAGLVNAVLRRVAAAGEPPLPDRARDEAAYISIAHSHPRWLVERWIANYGVCVAEAMCEADNRPAPICLRPNRRRATAEQLAAALAAEGLTAQPSPIAPGALRLTSGGNPTRTASYAAGLYSVQGEASIIVGLVAQPPAGGLVLDMCAGVGGKSSHMAELMDNHGLILAVDRQGSKLDKLNQECARLGITVIATREADARTLAASHAPRANGHRIGRGFDLCLLDAPCSGTGALRRRPDSRWRDLQQRIAPLAALQGELLRTAARLVRPGGIIVYSACSLEPEETEAIVAHATSEGLRMDDCRGIVSSVPESALAADGSIRLMPHLHDTDGMFIARLRRAESARPRTAAARARGRKPTPLGLRRS